MSVVYNGIHSVTFIESLQSITAGQTLTSFTSVRNTWNSFHLIPANRPYVSPMEPKIQLVTDTVSSKVFDITDAVAGGMTYSARKGSWDFLVDHDKWSNWYIAKQTIEDYLNGKRRYCFLNGDDTLLYCGRFKVSGWEDGTQYSKITIEYDLDYETYALSANLNRPTSLSVSWKSSAPTVYEHQKKDTIRNYLNATISYGGYYTGSCDIDVIEGSFSGTGSQSITVSYTANDLSTFETVKLTSSVSVNVSADYITAISVTVDPNAEFHYGDPKDNIRQYSTIICYYVSGSYVTKVAGTNANTISGTFNSVGENQVSITYSGKSASVTINIPIENTWECLNYAIDNDTYNEWFSIGDEFPLTIEDEYDGYAQIVDFDVDIGKYGQTIPVTFITKNLLNTDHKMNTNDTASGGYPASEMRTYIDSLEIKLPAMLQSMLVSANKTSRQYTPSNTTVMSSLKLWIPSMKEVGYDGYENTGVTYSTIFTNRASRKKSGLSGYTRKWWLRTAYAYNKFYYIDYDGYVQYDTSSYYPYSILLGFCVTSQAKHTYDSWEDIDTSIRNGSYRTKYKVGDLVPLQIGQDGSEYDGLAEIVAIDTDVDANGNTIPLTFITKGLLNTNHVMNSTATNTGAYPASEMRTYIDGLKSSLPVKLQTMIVAANKSCRDRYTDPLDGHYAGSYDISTNLELWIPSMREISEKREFTVETTGPSYSSLFNNDGKRIKYKLGDNIIANSWWTRTAYPNDTSFYCISNTGKDNYVPDANTTQGIALGFCVGASQS